MRDARPPPPSPPPPPATPRRSQVYDGTTALIADLDAGAGDFHAALDEAYSYSQMPTTAGGESSDGAGGAGSKTGGLPPGSGYEATGAAYGGAYGGSAPVI